MRKTNKSKKKKNLELNKLFDIEKKKKKSFEDNLIEEVDDDIVPDFKGVSEEDYTIDSESNELDEEKMENNELDDYIIDDEGIGDINNEKMTPGRKKDKNIKLDKIPKEKKDLFKFLKKKKKNDIILEELDVDNTDNDSKKKKKLKMLKKKDKTPKEKKNLFNFLKKKDKNVEVLNNVDNELDFSDNDEMDNISKKKKDKKTILDNKKKTKQEKTKVVKNKDASKNDKTKKKKTKRKFWKKLVTAFLILAITGVLLVVAFFGYIVLTAPEFNEAAFEVNDQTVVYDINGEIIAKLGVENRESVTYDQLPQVLIDAIIATEDSRYFQHNGVDLPRFIKAAFFQLLGRSDAGGASTLTMQMVKNSLTSTEDEGIAGIIRKFQDVYLAVFKVEKKYTKEKIIELYVNNHCLGSSIYGVGEASKYYFGKTVSELTLPEASILAGLFQAPNRHNPYKNVESATSRRNTVLNLMVRHGYITKQEADFAKSIPVDSLLVGIQETTDYQGYIDYVVTEVKNLTGYDPAVVPMKIYTTMEKNIQDGVNAVIKNNTDGFWRTEKAQAGIAIVNVETGAIAALSGQRNNSGERIFSYATDALRQPGSTAKPIFAYGPHIEYNNSSSFYLYTDEEWNYTGGPAVNNWDGQFHGIVTTRYALQYSRNVPALKAYQQVGSKRIQQFAYSLGLDVAYNSSSENYRIVDERTGLDNTINEAYSIGGVSEGFSPLMMAAAYSAFASGGYYTKPYSVTKIEFRENGEIIEYKPSKTRVMKDSTAYIMNNILESAVNSGFNGGAKVYGSHVAAKTGTSNFPDSVLKENGLPPDAVNDLWTVAYTSKYSIGVWYGYDKVDSKHYNLEGAYKDKVTAAVMKYIPKDTVGWRMPSSVVASQVEKQTYPAKLPSAYTPKNMILTEYFVRGTQPTEVSDRFAQLNDVENVKVVATGNSATITWDYTMPTPLTDEYLEEYFSQTVFGKSKDKLVDERKKYNEEILGPVTFGIYTENADGTLSLVAYTSENSYTYYGSAGNVTLVIKAEHSNYADNASNGITRTFTLENSDASSSSLSATLNGEPYVEIVTGTYTEVGIQSITFGGENITNSPLVTISYQLIVNGVSTPYTNSQKLVEAINQLPAGTYRINYIISYNDNRLIKNRTVTFK